ncbi:MAG: CorA family divalent cation transporter [Methyloceanibacter sp.]
MITIYEARDGTLNPQTGLPRVTDDSVRIDLLNPTPEEEDIIERALDMDVPTREELQEIEASSRLFQDDGSYFMTATLVFKGGTSEAQVTPVTFILLGNRLLTVRYAEPGAFGLFLSRCNRQELDLSKGSMVLTGLLEAVVDRLADFIEHTQGHVEQLSRSVFNGLRSYRAQGRQGCELAGARGRAGRQFADRPCHILVWQDRLSARCDPRYDPDSTE